MASAFLSSGTLGASWMEIPDLTLLIRRSATGDRAAQETLFSHAYPLMRRIAGGLIKSGPMAQTMEPGDLVHETLLKRGDSGLSRAQNRAHYAALATISLRDELIDHARKSKAKKRTLPCVEEIRQRLPVALPKEDVLALERQLKKLQKLDPRAAEVVRLRLYEGCSWQETADRLGVGNKVVRSEYKFAIERLAGLLGKPLRF